MQIKAMTKKQEEQLINNCIATGIFNSACNELDEKPCIDIKRLRSCSAWVYETDNFYILKSYETLVACIAKKNNACFDVLRYVYGFTSTSAQHISKFIHDYGSSYAQRYTWRNV